MILLLVVKIQNKFLENEYYLPAKLDYVFFYEIELYFFYVLNIKISVQFKNGMKSYILGYVD